MVKWIVKNVNEFIEDYSIASKDRYRHLEHSEWEFPNSDLVLKHLHDDVLDAPFEELTLEGVKKEYWQEGVEEKKYQQILEYYNWRLELYKKIEKDILGFRDSEGVAKKIFHYEIPGKYNTFAMKDEDEVKQTQGFVEIEFEMVD